VAVEAYIVVGSREGRRLGKCITKTPLSVLCLAVSGVGYVALACVMRDAC
jgi:hypothetical protein